MMEIVKKIEKTCPRCHSQEVIKSGKVKERQRYLCKTCAYHFTVNKMGKRLDDYYVIKALQLYLQGMGYREIERVLGISHVTVMKWVRQFFKQVPKRDRKNVEHVILNADELGAFMQNKQNLNGKSFLLTHLGAKILMIKWDE